MSRTVTVVGAGITGAAAAWSLSRAGWRVEVYERADVLGGHVRTEWLHGIPYEPHGAHIFHTNDGEIWRIVSEAAEFVPYRHRVLIRLRGRFLSWPLQAGEFAALPDFADIAAELGRRPEVADRTNFETYGVSLLGPTLYAEAVRDYTVKQWGCDPATLDTSIAEGRVGLRRDGYRDMFRDTYQGWPRRGYTTIVESLLRSASVHFGQAVTLDDVPAITRPGDPVIVTAPLDDFCGEPGTLDWRGVRLEASYNPEVVHAQPAMVVNEPASDVAWTRTVETKWALPELSDRPGTVVLREFPGARTKHYPVADAAGANRRMQEQLCRRLNEYRRNPLIPAGRLATYHYLNMDAAMRSGLDAARRVITG
ncbi:FAD-dependent oxidoreductase [Micromonospora palomenae]|uniref:FAD-dependent oxidoreductase n=1 Tax=Micromonospora palomenae TaxID=1461247 RepID=UPI003F8C3FC2